MQKLYSQTITLKKKILSIFHMFRSMQGLSVIVDASVMIDLTQNSKDFGKTSNLIV